VAASSTAAPAELHIPGEKIYPESITSSADGRVVIGSIGARTIYVVKPGAATAEPWIQRLMTNSHSRPKVINAATHSWSARRVPDDLGEGSCLGAQSRRGSVTFCRHGTCVAVLGYSSRGKNADENESDQKTLELRRQSVGVHVIVGVFVALTVHISFKVR
jgi:hypothetical protein